MYTFNAAVDVLALTEKYGVSFPALALAREQELTKKSEELIKTAMQQRLTVMRKAVDTGLTTTMQTMGTMGRHDATKIEQHLGSVHMMSDVALKAAMYAIATNEYNACMGCIVACPTAGSAGVVPGVFLAAEEHFSLSEEMLVEGLLVAAAIGSIIAKNATLSGAEGGCQAEIGSAIAMAAGGLARMRSGTTQQCFTAAALGLKNVLGLACDPIGGLVEVPCIKRNGFATQYAIFAADLALMGVESFVPFDEVVEALKNISGMMSAEIRETARGGLAISPTAQKISKELGL